MLVEKMSARLSNMQAIEKLELLLMVADEIGLQSEKITLGDAVKAIKVMEESFKAAAEANLHRAT